MLQRTHVIKFACASLVALGFSLATGEAKAATTIGYSGSNCRPTKASMNFVDYNAFSIYGLGPIAMFTPAQVTCPLPVPYTSGLTGTLTSVKVTVLDRNDGSNPGSIKDFSCSIHFQNSVGSTFSTAPVTPNLFTPSTPLAFTVDLNANVAGATMICDLPDKQGGNVSHILYYSVTTS